MNVDIWSREDWAKILDEHRVIVCTADILLNCLERSYIGINQINLLVLDEAHHAKKDNPYARVIRDHYFKESDASQRPRVFGMTASPVDAKTDVAQAASQLENLLNSRIITTGSLTSLQSLRRPEESNIYYNTSALIWDTALAQDTEVRTRDLPHLREQYEMSMSVSHHLGSWCADQCMLEVLLPRSRAKLDIAIEKSYYGSKRPEDVADMDQVRTKYHAALAHIEKNLNTTASQPVPGMWTDKVSVLMKLLDAEFLETSTNRCMVFVERQITARMLAHLFNRIGNGNLRCGYLIGQGRGTVFEQNQAFKQQVLTLAKFRRGQLNCLFATSVAEEGLDVPLCNLVVRFDLYKTMIQYVQSRGRARQNQSKFVHMINKNNAAEQHRRQQAQVQELSMRSWCAALPEDRQLLGEDKTPQLGASGSVRTFTDASTGATLTAENAMSWLNHFVAVMPTESDDPEYATYNVQSVGSRFIAEVILPPGAPLRCITGDLSDRKLSARQSAAFEMCLQLRKLNVMDAHFMPTYLKKLPVMRNALLAVNMKQAEPYDMLTKPEIWKLGRGTLPVKLWMTFVDFPDGFEHEHVSLVMLTRTEMPVFPQFDLFRIDGQPTRVIAHINPQSIDITKHELGLLSFFTLRVLKDVFSKTYAETTVDLSYFLAPVVNSHRPTASQPKTQLDWSMMQTIAAKDCDQWNSSVNTDILLDRLFVDKWDGARKFITQSIHPTLQPHDPVPDDAANFRWRANILDYSVSLFKKSRASATWTEAQPVINVEKLVLRRNMLALASHKEKQEGTKAYICPEPFRISMLPVPVATTCLAWPSVIWRFEAILIALEACAFVGISCEPSLALAAITKDTVDPSDDDEATRFHTGMGENYERLEFLGDCFLKLATTLAIFVQNSKDNEFESHVGRMLLLCNKRLFETSVAMGLPRYIRSRPFNRRLWYPEGLQLLEGKGINEEGDVFNTQKQALSEKTIADVSEALMGAAYLSHNDPDKWHADNWKNAILAVTKLVGQDSHPMQKWEDYASAYKAPEWQTRAPTASQRETASMIEKLHDYRFESPSLLRCAFTHGSLPHMCEQLPSYERLEFLGDALLDMAIVNYLFYRFPDKDPQWLTEAKTAMVSNKFFGALACKLGFHKHIRHSHAAIESAIRTYVVEFNEKLEHTGSTRDYWQHLSSPPKCLADIVEAYVGAMFIDSGFDYGQVQRFFDEHIRWHFEDMNLYAQYIKGHPVTVLHHLLDNEYGCRMGRVLNQPLPVATRGDRKELIIGVMIHNEMVAYTSGISVRYGSVRAASSALKVLREMTLEEFRAKYHCDCGGKMKEDVVMHDIVA